MAQPVINYAPETCAWCRGSGGVKEGEIIVICPACGGQGSVLVAQPARKCAWCRGSGGVKEGEIIVICPACGGTGWAHALRHEE